MRRKKKTTIVTFESRERIKIRQESRRMSAWCDRCGAEVLMVTRNEAAAVKGANPETILREIEAGRIHFIEDEAGALLVCSQSLARFQ